MDPFSNLVAVVLSNWMEVGGCGCTISTNVVLIGAHYFPFIYPALVSTSAADPITYLIIFDLIGIAPFILACSWKFLDG